MNKILFLVLGLAMLVGCTMTDSAVKLRCDIPAPIGKMSTTPDITIKSFVDGRRLDDPRFLYYKNSGIGKTSGRLFSEGVTTTDFITDLVKRTAQASGFRVVDNSDFVLSGKLLSMDSRILHGLFSASIESEMHAEIELTKASQVIRRESIVEKGEATDLHFGTDGDYEVSLEKMLKSLSTSVHEFLKVAFKQTAADAGGKLKDKDEMGQGGRK